MELTILMYHGITSHNSPALQNREEGAELYDVTWENFRAQMALAAKHKDNLLITFDDGEMNNYTNAFPILKEFGLTGLFFVIVDRVGTQGYLTWDQIRMMAAEGMRFGSHGLTHKILTQLNNEELVRELSLSKKILENNLGIIIEDISIPRGFCNDSVINEAHAQGFKNVYISHKPPSLKANGIPRMAVKGNWDIVRFKKALAGRIPMGDLIKGAVLTTAKTILGDTGYNDLRKKLVKKKL